MAWELDSKRSIYSQLVEIILKKIITGVYAPGTKIDSVRDLASEAGVNPNTMQRALLELERTGIIATQRTSGKFVTEDREMIERIRTDLAKEAVARLISDMDELGFGKEEVVLLIKQSGADLRKEQPKEEQPKEEQPKEEQPKKEQPRKEQPKEEYPKEEQPWEEYPREVE